MREGCEYSGHTVISHERIPLWDGILQLSSPKNELTLVLSILDQLSIFILNKHYRFSIFFPFFTKQPLERKCCLFYPLQDSGSQR